MGGELATGCVAPAAVFARARGCGIAQERGGQRFYFQAGLAARIRPCSGPVSYTHLRAHETSAHL
eukprot:12738021-Alexandrium_andersonii.AAC.1